jgi:regulator of protease activity HflC (stomatin/prohibitin superfamily)
MITFARRFASSASPREVLFESERRLGGMVKTWPVSKANTAINICRQGEHHVIERFGSFLRVTAPGLYFAIPLIDEIKRIDIKEKAIPIEPQMAISRDNVSVKMSGVVYLRFVDPVKAVYGHFSPLLATLQHSQSAMRSAIGELELDELFHDRSALNTKITSAISQAAAEWGIKVLRYEVTEIVPDVIISDAMDRQARAERLRREKVLEASGDKESQILRSQGELESRTNEALAKKVELQMHADGHAYAAIKAAEAQASALYSVAAALKAGHGETAAKIELSREYMRMMGQIGSTSNTIFFGEQAGDVSMMMARIAAAFQASLSNINTGNADVQKPQSTVQATAPVDPKAAIPEEDFVEGMADEEQEDDFNEDTENEIDKRN